MPPPEQKLSNEPSFPYPLGPQSMSRQWPTSPALPLAPRYSLPSRISPAPKPVPKVRNTMLPAPRPAPQRHSASAQALASFSSRAGAPSAFAAQSVSETPDQPGRLGGFRRHLRPVHRVARAEGPAKDPLARG